MRRPPAGQPRRRQVRAGPRRLPRPVRLARAPTSGRCRRPRGEPTPSWRWPPSTACARSRPTPGRSRNWDERAADRERADRARWREQLAGNPEVQGQFLAAVRAAGLFLAGRERTKTTIIKLDPRGASRVPRDRPADGRRRSLRAVRGLRHGHATTSTTTSSPTRPSTATSSPSGARCSTSCSSSSRRSSSTAWSRRWSEWRRRGSTPVEVAGAGDALVGIPGCPGEYTGRARVILSPDDPHALEPGDVLVAPITDPAWTPLFVPAGAVVVDVGAQISHAVIVSRGAGHPLRRVGDRRHPPHPRRRDGDGQRHRRHRHGPLGRRAGTQSVASP